MNSANKALVLRDILKNIMSVILKPKFLEKSGFEESTVNRWIAQNNPTTPFYNNLGTIIDALLAVIIKSGKSDTILYILQKYVCESEYFGKSFKSNLINYTAFEEFLKVVIEEAYRIQTNRKEKNNLDKTEAVYPEVEIIPSNNNELKNIPNDKKEKEHGSTTAVPKSLTLLPIKPQYIIGRKATFDDIDKLGDKVLLISGLGGIGKTELCRSYFWEKYTEFDYVGWIDYESGIKESILNQIKTDLIFDDSENIDEKYQRILRYLSSLKSCLLVIDNINRSDDKNLNDISRFPFRVIANSRMKYGNFTLYNLGFIDVDGCKELFCKHCRNVSDEDIFFIEKIIEISGYHTLTIELLAKQCKYSALSAKELYELLKIKGLSLQGIKEKIAATVKNEVENRKLIEHLQKLFQLFNLDDEVERYILSNLSILPSIFISKKDIKKWLDLESLNELNSLIDKGWITEEDNLIRLHEVISEVIRNSDIRPDFERCKTLIEHLGELFKNDYNHFDENNYILFGESVLKHVKENTQAIADLADSIAQIYEEQGYYIHAESLYKRALDIREQILDEMHPDIATSLNNLGVIYKRLGKYSKAKSLFKKALNIREQKLGDMHPDTAISLHNLAVLYRSSGKYDKAELFYKKALDTRKHVLGDMHLDTAESINSLAVLYKSQGKYDKAEELHRRALEISVQVLGDKHPTTAVYLNSLGLLYYNQGKYDEAESQYKKALGIREQVLGEKHPDTATSLHNLAGLYERQGKFDKAKALFIRVLDIRRQVFGNVHPSVVSTLNNLATLYAGQGKYDKAEPLFEEALKISEQLLDGQHPTTVISLNNLAGLYRSQCKYDKAEPLFEKALKISEQILGNKHPSTAISLNNLAGLYESQGKYDKAESLYKKALNMREQVLGDKHPGITTFLLNLAELYRSQGKYHEARSLYKRVFEIRGQLTELKDFLQKEFSELQTDTNTDSVFIIPETTLEEKLVKLCKEVFQLKDIGVEENFFEIGGDSIMLILLTSRIQKELGVSIEVSDLWQSPSIRETATCIEYYNMKEYEEKKSMENEK